MKEYVELRLLDDPDSEFRVIAEGNRSFFQRWIDDITNSPSNLTSYKDMVTGEIIRPSFINGDSDYKFITDNKHLLYDNYYYQRIISEEKAFEYIKELQDREKLINYLDHLKLVKHCQKVNNFKIKNKIKRTKTI